MEPHPNSYLKLAGKTLVPALVDMYNYRIAQRVVFFPRKTARLSLIFKKDEETEYGNYPPVSLLSVPRKILEVEKMIDRCNVFSRTAS